MSASLEDLVSTQSSARSARHGERAGSIASYAAETEELEALWNLKDDGRQVKGIAMARARTRALYELAKLKAIKVFNEIKEARGIAIHSTTGAAVRLISTVVEAGRDSLRRGASVLVVGRVDYDEGQLQAYELQLCNLTAADQDLTNTIASTSTIVDDTTAGRMFERAMAFEAPSSGGLLPTWIWGLGLKLVWGRCDFTRAALAFILDQQQPKHVSKFASFAHALCLIGGNALELARKKSDILKPFIENLRCLRRLWAYHVAATSTEVDLKAIPTLKWLTAPQQQPASMDPQVDARGRQRLEARRLAGAERASFRQWRSSKALLRLEQLAARDEYAPYLIDAIEHVSLGDLGVAVIEHGAHAKKAPCTHGEAIAAIRVLGLGLPPKPRPSTEPFATVVRGVANRLPFALMSIGGEGDSAGLHGLLGATRIIGALAPLRSAVARAAGEAPASADPMVQLLKSGRSGGDPMMRLLEPSSEDLESNPAVLLDALLDATTIRGEGDRRRWVPFGDIASRAFLHIDLRGSTSRSLGNPTFGTSKAPVNLQAAVVELMNGIMPAGATQIFGSFSPLRSNTAPNQSLRLIDGLPAREYQAKLIERYNQIAQTRVESECKLLGWTFKWAWRSEGGVVAGDYPLITPAPCPDGSSGHQIRSYPDLKREFDTRWGGSYFSVDEMKGGKVRSDDASLRPAQKHCISIDIRNAHYGLKAMVATAIRGRRSTEIEVEALAPVMVVHVDRWIVAEARRGSSTKVENDFEPLRLDIPETLQVRSPEGAHTYRLAAAVTRTDAHSTLSTLWHDPAGIWVRSSQVVEKSDENGYPEWRRRELLEEIGRGFVNPTAEALDSISGGARTNAAELLFFVRSTETGSLQISADGMHTPTSVATRRTPLSFEVLRRRQFECGQLSDALAVLGEHNNKQLAVELAQACQQRYLHLEQRLIQRIRQLQDGPTTNWAEHRADELEAMDTTRDLVKHHLGRTSEFEFARLVQRFARSIIRGPRSNKLLAPSPPDCANCTRVLAEASGVWEMLECDGLVCSSFLNSFRYAVHKGCLSDEQASVRVKALVCNRCLPFAGPSAQPAEEKASWQLDDDEELASRKRANMHPDSYLLGPTALGNKTETETELEAIRSRRVAFPMLTANNKVVFSTNAERFELAAAEAGLNASFSYEGKTHLVPFLHLFRAMAWIMKSNYDVLPPKCKPVHANARQIPDGATCGQGNQEAELLEEENPDERDGLGTLLTSRAALPLHASDPRLPKLKRRVFPQPHIMSGIEGVTWQRRKHEQQPSAGTKAASGLSAAKVAMAAARTETLRAHYITITRTMRAFSLLSGAVHYAISPASYSEMHSHLIKAIRYQPIDWAQITTDSGIVVESVDALASVYVSPQPPAGLAPDPSLIPTAKTQELLDLAVKAWVTALAGLKEPLKLSAVPQRLLMPREGKDGELLSTSGEVGGSNEAGGGSNSNRRQPSSPSAPSATSEPTPAGKKKKIDALIEEGQQGLAKKAKGKEKESQPRASTEAVSKEAPVAYLQLLVGVTDDRKELPEWRKDARKSLDAPEANSKLEFDSHLGGGVIVHLQAMAIWHRLVLRNASEPGCTVTSALDTHLDTHLDVQDFLRHLAASKMTTFGPGAMKLAADPQIPTEIWALIEKMNTCEIDSRFADIGYVHAAHERVARLAIKHYGGSRERADSKTLGELKQELAWPMPTIGSLEGQVLKLGDDTSLSAVPSIAAATDVCYIVVETMDVQQATAEAMDVQQATAEATEDEEAGDHPHLTTVPAETLPQDGKLLFKIIQRDEEHPILLQASKEDLSNVTVDALVHVCATELGQDAICLALVVGRQLRVTETSRSTVRHHWAPNDEELNRAMELNTKKCVDARFLTMTQRILRWQEEHTLFAKLQTMTHDAYGACSDHGAERRSTQPATRYKQVVELLKARYAGGAFEEYVLCILTLNIIAADTSEPNLEMLLDGVVTAEKAKRPLLPLRRTTGEGKLDVAKSAAAVRAVFDVLENAWRVRQASTPDSRALDPCSDILTLEQVVDRLSHRSRRKQPREAETAPPECWHKTSSLLFSIVDITAQEAKRLFVMSNRDFIKHLAPILVGGDEILANIANRERRLWMNYDDELPRPDASQTLSVQDVHAGAYKGLLRNLQPLLQEKYGSGVDLRYVTIDQGICKRIVGAGPKLYGSYVAESLKWLQQVLGEEFHPFLKKITPFLRSLRPMTLCGFEVTLCDPNKVVDALENGTRGLNGRLCAKLEGLDGHLRALGTLDKPDKIHMEYVDFTSKDDPRDCMYWLDVPAL